MKTSYTTQKPISDLKDVAALEEFSFEDLLDPKPGDQNKKKEDTFSGTDLHGNLPRYLDSSICKLLNAEKEFTLAHACRNGDKDARRKLIEGNLRLVVNIAKRFQGRGIDLEELIAEGHTGLMRAVEKFDPNKGFRLSTFATHWISKAIGRAIEKNSRTIRLPVHVSESLSKIDRAQLKLKNDFGREPTLDEVSYEVGFKPNKVRELLINRQQTVSLDTPRTDDGGTFGDIIVDRMSADDIIKTIVPSQIVTSVEAILEGDMKMVLEMKYGLGPYNPMDFEDIAAELRITIDKAKKLHKYAIRALKRYSPKGQHPYKN